MVRNDFIRNHRTILFENNVNGESYVKILNEFIWPKVMRKRLTFHQVGASAHYATNVRCWLDDKFPNRWIGRRGPIVWPARSPDLTPCDFFLWGYLKNIVYKDRPATIEQLREPITQACAEILIEIIENACKRVSERFKRCIEENGKQQL